MPLPKIIWNVFRLLNDKHSIQIICTALTRDSTIGDDGSGAVVARPRSPLSFDWNSCARCSANARGTEKPNKDVCYQAKSICTAENIKYETNALKYCIYIVHVSRLPRSTSRHILPIRAGAGTISINHPFIYYGLKFIYFCLRFSFWFFSFSFASVCSACLCECIGVFVAQFWYVFFNVCFVLCADAVTIEIQSGHPAVAAEKGVHRRQCHPIERRNDEFEYKFLRLFRPPGRSHAPSITLFLSAPPLCGHFSHFSLYAVRAGVWINYFVQLCL